MTKFITYIELHNAELKDYQRLNADMKKALFTTAGATDTTGKIEFSYYGRRSIKDVIDTVVRVAVKTGKKFSFTVMKDKTPKNNVPKTV